MSRRGGWIRIAVPLVLVVLAGILGLRWVGLFGGPKFPVGYPLKVLKLEPLSASTQSVALADLTGKVTIINYWATWCAPCVEEFPHLASLAKSFQNRDDFLWLSVSTGHPDDETLRRETAAFLSARGYDVPVYDDPQSATRAGLTDVPLHEIPLTVVIDREGKVAKVLLSYSPAELEEVKLLVAALLQSRPN